MEYTILDEDRKNFVWFRLVVVLFGGFVFRQVVSLKSETEETNMQTQVKVSGKDITITVPIDVAGVDSDTARLWEKGAEKIWNDAFAGSDNP